MYDREFVGDPTDYSDISNWLKRPFGDECTLPVDVIYLAPSSCFDPEAGKICAVDNPSLREVGAAHYTQVASCFEGVGNVFFPWWRQVNASLLSSMDFDEIDELEFSEPRTDVYAMLDYYFAYLNDGRPFILAGHSQGSRLIGMIMSEYMVEHPRRFERMVAAYRIGDGLTKDYLAANPQVKPAQAEDDLGVCISWNTEGPKNLDAKSLVIPPNCVCINPLNWRTDEEPASVELNIGSMIPNMADGTVKQIRGVADARIDLARGSVIVSEEQAKNYTVSNILGAEYDALFGPESYHMCDYGFFYFNIRDNAKLRAQKWLDTH